MPFDNHVSDDARILLRAADLVMRGHCKNTLFKQGGTAFDWSNPMPLAEITEVCLAGAIIMAIAEAHGDTVLAAYCNQPASPHCARALTMVGGGVAMHNLVNFNNADDTTPAMVADKLREMAAVHA